MTTTIPLNLEEFKERLIRDGIASVEANEKRESRRRGGIHGFELCRPLNRLKDFEALIAERHSEEIRLGAELTEKRQIENIETYWEHRSATIQVEFVYERMKAVMAMNGQYQGPLSVRAVIQTARILGLTE
jgi:hypothetical protein